MADLDQPVAVGNAERCSCAFSVTRADFPLSGLKPAQHGKPGALRRASDPQQHAGKQHSGTTGPADCGGTFVV